jgi:hypothetical protein
MLREVKKEGEVCFVKKCGCEGGVGDRGAKR